MRFMSLMAVGVLALAASVAHGMPEKAVPMAPVMLEPEPEPYPPEGTTLMARVRLEDNPAQSEEALILHGCVMGYVTCEGDYPAIFISHHEATEFMVAHYTAWLIMPEQVEPFSLGAHWENTYGVRSQLSNVIHNRRTIPVITTVPEPGTWLLLGSGLVGLGFLWWLSERKLRTKVDIRRDGAGKEIKWAGRFMELDEIVDEFYSKLMDEAADNRPEGLQSWLKVKNEDELLCGHHSVGRYIRNHYGFWFEDHPYANPKSANSDAHPDQMSMEVMVRLWRRLQEEFGGDVQSR